MRTDGDYISREEVLALTDDYELTLQDDEIFFEYIDPKKVAAIHAADVRPKWISVDERMPELHDAEYLDEVTGELIRYKESAPILIWLAKGGFMDIGIYEKSDAVDDFCYQGVPHTVTFWMPMPEPPEEEGQ